MIASKTRNYIKVHEHDFIISIGAENRNETSIICPMCDLRYCGKCGKLVNNKMDRCLTLEC